MPLQFQDYGDHATKISFYLLIFWFMHISNRLVMGYVRGVSHQSIYFLQFLAKNNENIYTPILFISLSSQLQDIHICTNIQNVYMVK